LLLKHGLTEAQLDEVETTTVWFRAKTETDRLILRVVIARLANNRKWPLGYVLRFSKRPLLGFDLTKAQAIDAEIQYDFYRAQWEKESDLFLRAFIFANNLGLAASDAPAELTEEQIRQRKRIAGMQMFVDNSSPHRRLAEVCG
jgi:hypothetical protein